MTSKVFHPSELTPQEAHFWVVPCLSHRALWGLRELSGDAHLHPTGIELVHIARQHQTNDCPLGPSSGMTAAMPEASAGMPQD